MWGWGILIYLMQFQFELFFYSLLSIAQAYISDSLCISFFSNTPFFCVLSLDTDLIYSFRRCFVNGLLFRFLQIYIIFKIICHNVIYQPIKIKYFEITFLQTVFDNKIQILFLRFHI